MQKILIVDELEGHRTVECKTIQEVREVITPYLKREDMWLYNEQGELMNSKRLTDRQIKEAGNIKIALSQTGG